MKALILIFLVVISSCYDFF